MLPGLLRWDPAPEVLEDRLRPGVRACAIGSLIRPLGFIGFIIRFYRFYRCLGLVCSSEFGFRV